jgi:hypothetical protein
MAFGAPERIIAGNPRRRYLDCDAIYLFIDILNFWHLFVPAHESNFDIGYLYEVTLNSLCHAEVYF